ncbi:MAG: DNA methyltransferase [Candidatus Thorarchaeota archaeon]
MDKYFENDDDFLSIDWDFKLVDTKEYTHGIHLYPARMVPHIARALIDKFSDRNQIVLDPFCGSGTVLLESAILGRKAIGIDINPLAVLISQGKSIPIDYHLLDKELDGIEKRAKKQIIENRSPVHVPEFKLQKQIDFWFKKKAQKDLALLREIINDVKNPNVRKFFRVVFSDTVRKTSNTRDSEYKLYRRSPEDLVSYNPDGIETFLQFSRKAISGMKRLIKRMNDSDYHIPDVRQGNFIESQLDNNSVDLMVTSPPYGDSHTTVGYGQFSKFSLLWLGDEMSEYIPTSSDMLGGRKRCAVVVDSPSLDETLIQIRQNEHDLKNKREFDVKSFFADYQDCIKKISYVLKDGSKACFVVGNRSVREVRIRLDTITQEIGENFGLKYKSTILRNIPTKRLPSTQNLYVDPKWDEIKGKRDAKKIENIVKESIVIMEK